MIIKEKVMDQMTETIANLMNISYFDALPLIKDEYVNFVLENMTESFTSDCYTIVEQLKKENK